MDARTVLWMLLSVVAAAATSPAMAKPAILQGEKIVLLRAGGAGTSVGEFVTTRNQPPKESTTATVFWEKHGLRVRFECTDSKVSATERERDYPEIWRDDGVEVFIDRNHTHSDLGSWKHFIVNAVGSVFDETGPTMAYFANGDSIGGNRTYNSKGLQATTARTATGWKADLFVPWVDLGGAPRAGEVWGFNLARGNQPNEEYSCFSPTMGSFYNMSQWGHLVFDDGHIGEAAAKTAIRARHREVIDLRNKETDMKRCLAPMPELGKTWVEVNGQIYGAKADESGPLGGGPGYKAIVTKGDYQATNIDELIAALKQAKAGQIIFIPGEVEIDFTVRVFVEELKLQVPAGVTLASDRGHDGSRGALLYSDTFKTTPLLNIVGPDVRITGLRLRGPDPEARLDLHDISEKLGGQKGIAGGFDQEYYYKFPVSLGIDSDVPRLTVDNCELAGWSLGAVQIKSGAGHHIHHNYIHHNQRNGLGYGVCLGNGDAVALIEYNVFNYNRHSIAATGKPGNAYEARHNVEVEHSLSHCFDMHGGRDRQDGNNIAGDWMKVSNNTFFSAAKPLRIRGVPVQEAQIYRNWFPHHRPDAILELTPVETEGNTRVYDNVYGMEKLEFLDKK